MIWGYILLYMLDIQKFIIILFKSDVVHWLQINTSISSSHTRIFASGGTLYVSSLFWGYQNSNSSQCPLLCGHLFWVLGSKQSSAILLLPANLLPVTYKNFFFFPPYLSPHLLYSCLAFWKKKYKLGKHFYDKFPFLFGKINFLLVKNVYVWEPVWNSEVKINT